MIVNEAEGIYLKDSLFLVREIPNEWERRNAIFNLTAFSAKRYAAGERLARPPSVVCRLDLPNWSKFVEANLERSFSGERVYKDDKLKCNLSLLSIAETCVSCLTCARELHSTSARLLLSQLCSLS